MEFLVIAGVLNDPDCAKEPNKEGNQRAYFVDFLEKDEALPLCIQFNEFLLNDRLPSHNYGNYETKVVVVRKFYTTECPPYLVDGAEQPLNAFVIKRLESQDIRGQRIFMCAESLLRKKKVPEIIIPGTGGRAELETDIQMYRERPEIYAVSEILHDDRCGREGGLNAYRVDFNRLP